jgi:hypothetical protein
MPAWADSRFDPRASPFSDAAGAPYHQPLTPGVNEIGTYFSSLNNIEERLLNNASSAPTAGIDFVKIIFSLLFQVYGGEGPRKGKTGVEAIQQFQASQPIACLLGVPAKFRKLAASRRRQRIPCGADFVLEVEARA